MGYIQLFSVLYVNSINCRNPTNGRGSVDRNWPAKSFGGTTESRPRRTHGQPCRVTVWSISESCDCRALLYPRRP